MANAERFIVQGLEGKRTLEGELQVLGAKNAVLPLLASAILFKDGIELSNVPLNEDVKRISEILEKMGVVVTVSNPGKLSINTKSIDEKGTIDRELAKKIRASIFLSGPALARFGRVTFPKPGGCVIGARPIDLFIENYEKMGATITTEGDEYVVTTDGKLKGCHIFFPLQSVSATETFLMAAVLAKGKTILENVACEPEVVALAEYLNACGAKIEGAGSSTITITGTGLLSSKGEIAQVIPDRIEAASFLILGALSAKQLKITHCRPSDMRVVIELLRKAGVDIEEGKNSLTVRNNPDKPTQYQGFSFRTHEYPGVPTDIQPQLATFLTQAVGESPVFETIFEGRLNYTTELVRMGANILICDPHRAIVKGPTPLEAEQIDAPDIRAGFAYIIAALLAKGYTTIRNIYYIDRGHEAIESRLQAIGVDIRRVADTPIV